MNELLNGLYLIDISEEDSIIKEKLHQNEKLIDKSIIFLDGLEKRNKLQRKLLKSLKILKKELKNYKNYLDKKI